MFKALHIYYLVGIPTTILLFPYYRKGVGWGLRLIGSNLPKVIWWVHGRGQTWTGFFPIHSSVSEPFCYISSHLGTILLSVKQLLSLLLTHSIFSKQPHIMCMNEQLNTSIFVCGSSLIYRTAAHSKMDDHEFWFYTEITKGLGPKL